MNKYQLSPFCLDDSFSAFSPCHWILAEQLSDHSINYPFSIKFLLGYLLRYNFSDFFNKLMSRLADSSNSAKASYGLCIARKIVESCKLSDRIYLCFVPFTSSLDSIFVVHESMYLYLSPEQLANLSGDTPSSLSSYLLQYKGWSPYSGVSLCAEGIVSELSSFKLPCSLPLHFPKSVIHYQTLFTSHIQPSPDRKSVSLFGLGNYSKTIILPCISAHWQLNSLHEIDPSQISGIWFKKFSNVSSSPFPNSADLNSSVWFIASYHHTHAATAEQALQNSIIPVIEKPLFTTLEQLNSFRHLLASLESPTFFSCFQKRYQTFNSFIYDDLSVEPGDPINMSAFVFEIPLPKYHWYNWPNSRSRIISNACHWIDYFFYVNAYADVESIDRFISSSAIEVISITLINSAHCLISITDFGSSRLGVREHIELRTRCAQSIITDSSTYVSENSTSVIRRVTVNPLSAHKNMYNSIMTKIKHSLPGDSVRTLLSSEIALKLDLSPPLR